MVFVVMLAYGDRHRRRAAAGGRRCRARVLARWRPGILWRRAGWARSCWAGTLLILGLLVLTGHGQVPRGVRREHGAGVGVLAVRAKPGNPAARIRTAIPDGPSSVEPHEPGVDRGMARLQPLEPPPANSGSRSTLDDSRIPPVRPGALPRLRLADRPGRVDEADVAERLREVADQLARLGIDLLGEQSDVVDEADRALEGRRAPRPGRRRARAPRPARRCRAGTGPPRPEPSSPVR
jgi:hypothetical protein